MTKGINISAFATGHNKSENQVSSSSDFEFVYMTIMLMTEFVAIPDKLEKPLKWSYMHVCVWALFQTLQIANYSL